jgi:hypothetical protein
MKSHFKVSPVTKSTLSTTPISEPNQARMDAYSLPDLVKLADTFEAEARDLRAMIQLKQALN